MVDSNGFGTRETGRTSPTRHDRAHDAPRSPLLPGRFEPVTPNSDVAAAALRHHVARGPWTPPRAGALASRRAPRSSRTRSSRTPILERDHA